MNSRLFVDGSISLEWNGVRGQSGLQPRLLLLGKLVAKDYGIGAVVQVTADITAWNIVGSYAYLGSATPKSYALNWIQQEPDQPNPQPKNERNQTVELPVPLSPSVIEGLEERRQGKDFSIRIDTTVVLLDRGESKGPRAETFYGPKPILPDQDEIRISQYDWGQVLESWDRGVGIPIVVPLTALEPDPKRAEIVRHLKDARQKIDGADYAGSFACSRKALELLRGLSRVKNSLSNNPKDRDALERINAVIQALFNLASASAHVDGETKGFEPTRADAVGLAGATASIVQEVFAHIKV